MDKVKEWIENHGDEHCQYCIYASDCQGMTCYGGEPIFPYCAEHKPEQYLDEEAILKDLENGVIKIEP